MHDIQIIFQSPINVLNFQTLYSILFSHFLFLFVHLFLKILSGTEDRVDPDQTASGAV